MKKILVSLCIVCNFVTSSFAHTPKPPVNAIASASPFATHAGMEIFKRGGNAFDAAVAVAAALAVVEPYNSGLGGGGFILFHDAKKNKTLLIDGREVAPGAATADMYLDHHHRVVEGRSVSGALAAAIPGEPAAITYLGKQYGRLPLILDIEPAIDYADNGFPVQTYYRNKAKERLSAIKASPAAAHAYLMHGKVPPLGYLVYQPYLAQTLRALANQGRDGFYKGAVAKKLVRGVRQAGGLWTEKDLNDYHLVIREPLQGTYQGISFITAPPPSAGGIALITMLNMLETFSLSSYSDVERKHLTIEAMRRAFWERGNYLGDPAFVDIPIDTLTNKEHGKLLARSIDKHRATPNTLLSHAPTAIEEGQHTTHFSVLDKEGNWVAATFSLNYAFGSGVMPKGTGVLLNNEMDDFSKKPGAPNIYGLLGSRANAIAPGKRPLSSMMPTVVDTQQQLVILGTPGGSRIPTMMLLSVLGISQGDNLATWIARPRYHHQYIPDVVEYEANAFTAKEKKVLQKMGYTLQRLSRPHGDMEAIVWNKQTGQVYVASDPRRDYRSQVN